MKETTRYIPKSVNNYQGSQVIINSDRLVFNAKNDSILHYSDKSIGFSAKGSIYFDTSNNNEEPNASKFVINSPKIYLGLKEGIDEGKLPTERAVLGNELRKYLNEILSLMEELLDDLDYNYAVVSTRPGLPSLPCEDNALWMDQRKEVIKELKNDLAINNLDQLLNADDCSFLSKRIKII